MYYYPNDLWIIIKDYLIEYKKHHKIKFIPILENNVKNKFKPIFERWTLFPPWPNTNNIIQDEYPGELQNWMISRPEPNLPLVSITWNIKGTGGWWCGYGWKKLK